MGASGGKALHAIGKTQGGWTTKIHFVADALGYPIDFKIMEGHINDNIPAEKLLEGKISEYVIADKAYDTNDLRRFIAAQGKTAVIPNQARRSIRYEYDKHVYKERRLIENFFQRIKAWRRVATRYEKNMKICTGLYKIRTAFTLLMF